LRKVEILQREIVSGKMTGDVRHKERELRHGKNFSSWELKFSHCLKSYAAIRMYDCGWKEQGWLGRTVIKNMTTRSQPADMDM
jgi:hypothetical protein